MRPIFHALRWPLAFAIVAALISFYPLCLETYRLVLDEKAPLNIQEEMSRQLPIPRALAWTPATKNLVSSLTLLAPGAVIGLGIGLFAIPLYGILRLLNPTFRLTTGVDWDKTVLTETYIHTAPLIKSFLILMAALIPLFILWAGLPVLIGNSPASVAFRLVLTGAVFWLLFSRDGIAGDYDSLNYEFPRERPGLFSLLGRGALAGLGAAVILWLWRYTESASWFDFFSSLGSIGESHWRTTALMTGGAAAFLGFAAALLLNSLAPPGETVGKRGRWGAAAAGMLLLFFVGRALALPEFLARRYDYDPARAAVDNAGVTRAARSLSQKTGIPLRPAEMQTVLIFRRDRLAAWNVPLTSVTGLDISADSTRRLEEFLAGRGYTTSLADVAFKTLHDSASIRWDTPASLQVDMRNLLRAPDIQYLRLLIEKLRSSPSTPEVLRLADQLADENRFAYVTRNARMVMGDVYAALGRRDKAASWYRKAGVPLRRLPEILSERTMFAEGKITGRLLLNNQPLAGAKVGIAPFLSIREAFGSMLAPGVVRPFWLRWIGPTALTAADGRFEITGITAREYRMLFSHPDLRLPPLDPRVTAENLLRRIFIGYGNPRADLGDIRLNLAPTGPLTPPASLPPRSQARPASPEPPPPSGR